MLYSISPRKFIDLPGLAVGGELSAELSGLIEFQSRSTP